MHHDDHVVIDDYVNGSSQPQLLRMSWLKIAVQLIVIGAITLTAVLGLGKIFYQTPEQQMVALPDIQVDKRVVMAKEVSNGVDDEREGTYWSTQRIDKPTGKHSSLAQETDDELGAVVTSVLIALGCFFLVVFFYVLIISRHEMTAKDVAKEQ